MVLDPCSLAHLHVSHHRFVSLLSIGYIFFYHDFQGGYLELSICIFMDVLRSLIEVFVVICQTLINLTYLILSKV